MDNIENLQESDLQDNIDSGDLIEVGDNVQDLKYSDDEDASYEKTETSIEDILMENKTVSLEEQSLKFENNMNSRENNFAKSSLSSSGVSDLLVPSAAIAALEKNDMESNEICLENPFTSDNFLKQSLDDECNSDMQDEEIQLRWDDDDDDEVSFTSGPEEGYDSSAHLIKTETSMNEGDDEFVVQEIQIENTLHTQQKSSADEENTKLLEGMGLEETDPGNYNISESVKISAGVQIDVSIAVNQCDRIDFNIDSAQNSQDSIDIIKEIEAVEKELPLTKLKTDQLTDVSVTADTSESSHSGSNSLEKVAGVEKEFRLEMEQADYAIDKFENIHDAKEITDEIDDAKEVGPSKNEKIIQPTGIDFKIDRSENSCETKDIEDVEKELPLGTVQIDQHANSTKDIKVVKKELCLKSLKTDQFVAIDSTSIENSNDGIDISKEIESTDINGDKGITVNTMEINQLTEAISFNDNFSKESADTTNLPELNLVTDNEKLSHDHNIFAVDKEPKNEKFMVDAPSTDNMEMELNLEESKTVKECSAFKEDIIINKEEKELHEKVIEVSSEQPVKGSCSDLNDDEIMKHMADSPAKVNTKLHDSVGEIAIGILTQHGLRKPDVMLEIPTKDLMNFMDEDDDDLCLLDNLAMSPDDAGIEIDDQDDDIKEMNITESLKNEPTVISDKDLKTPSIISEKEDDNDKPFSKIFTKENIEVKRIQNSEKNQTPNVREKPVLEAHVDEPQPSTSKACMVMEMRRDSDEVGEVSDSLGLLAESTRVEYDEEQDDDDYRDDDEDFYQDEESSNQMAVEYSEESNAMHSESDLPKTSQIDSDNAQDSSEKDNIQKFGPTKGTNFNFQINEVLSESDNSKSEDTKNRLTENADVLSTQNKLSSKDDKHMESKKGSNDSEEQTDDGILHTCPDKGTENKEDHGISTQLPMEKEDDKTKETINQSDVLLGTQNDMDKEELVVCLESSSDEESGQPKAKTPLLGVGMETSNLSEDMSRSIASPVAAEKSLSDSNLDKKMDEQTTASPEKEMRKSPKGLQVFSIDSDDEEQTRLNAERSADRDWVLEEVGKQQEVSRCVNSDCKSGMDVQYYEADLAVCKFYEEELRKDSAVCEPCVNAVVLRNQELIEGIKTFVPLLDLHSGKYKEELVEISDSESEEEDETEVADHEKIGEAGAKLVGEELGDLFNETWVKYKMDSRLDDATSELQEDLGNVNADTEELDVMLNDCQMMIDSIRNELYESFPQERKELPAITIIDTSTLMYVAHEDDLKTKIEPPQTRLKRRMSTLADSPAKRSAVLPAQLASENGQQDAKRAINERADDDNVDVSVVKLSAETAPADLPPPGEASRPPLRVGLTVFAMRNTFGLWLRARIVEVQPRSMYTSPFTMCRVRFDHKVNKNPFKLLPARCLAYSEPAEVRLTIGTRVIASSDTTQSYYSGVVAEVPNPVNNYRYLVFFDDGHAKYARHANTRLVCEHSTSVWEEVHPNSRDFVRQYLLSYPERPMVRLHPGQSLKTEWNNKWYPSRVVQVDASLALIKFASDRLEWIYRGSTRLSPLYLEMQAPERPRARPLPRSAHQFRNNVPYVEYTRYDEQQSFKGPTGILPQQQSEEIKRGQRAVAKKSLASCTAATNAPAPAPANLDDVTSRVVYYTPKNAVRPFKLVPHQCGPKCKRTDVLALKDLRTYNPLAKPLLSGWERQVVRFKGHKEVIYRAPCGRRLRNMAELHRYLRLTKSDMSVDLFDYGPNTHCLAEFLINKCIVGKKDLSHGKENVAVPCVNYYDETLPEFCSYNTERTPTAGVPLNLDPDFLCGCDCEDDCEDKTKCACWKMTIEGARTIGLSGDVGYVYRRLPEQLPSGIYECNSRCKCKTTCLNRVAQHPLQLKLQVFKTLNRGWGIRALNDVPKGAFLCVYAGNLLTDATANLDGLNEGDEYLAELDYIEVVEQMKEGYEDDIPESLKKDDLSSDEENVRLSKDEIDDDFQPGHVDVGPADIKKRLRTRERRRKDHSEDEKDKDNDSNKEKAKPKEEADKENGDEDCITISDDEEVAREPSRFMAQAGMDANQLVSKNRSVRSYFGKDEACYIMDAKVQGNIGRYLNHSCCPNVFVQNVFVDTHDPRFPWVAFFALSHIRAGTELTWNYNYDVGSVPGKVLYCYCGSANCKGRLL